MANMTTNDNELEETLRGVLKKIFGYKLDSLGMIDTPRRILGYWREFSQPETEIDIKDFECETSDQIILIRDIKFTSICEHHLLPFFGAVNIAYIPRNQTVIGLSKIPRIVSQHAKKPQLQERLGVEIKDRIVEEIDPLGIAIIITARHTCMEARGIRAEGAETKTSIVSGVFRTDACSRSEILRIARNELLMLLGK